MSTPTKIQASGVPFVPSDDDMKETFDAHFERYLKLDLEQTRRFSSHLFGALGNIGKYVPLSRQKIADAIDVSLTYAEAK